MIIVPYNSGSHSAKVLAEALDCKRVKVTGSRVKPKLGETIINMGNKDANHPAFKSRGVVLNHPNILISKGMLYNENNKNYFNDHGLFLPESTTSKPQAVQWEGKVFGRKLLNSHSGKGIIVYENGSDILSDSTTCPLYTRYFKNSKEFRIHFFNNMNGETKLLFQQKKKKKGSESANELIRNFSNGWIYAVNDIEVPDAVRNIGMAARYLPQDFGAMDVVYSVKRDSAVLLEVNSCPGMFSPTVIQFYVDNIEGDNHE